MSYNILYILFITIFTILISIWAYVSYITFYVDSDDVEEEEYNIMINQN